jgi:hypothetical protein
MKKFASGLIVFDTKDMICLSFSLGSGTAILIRTYRKYKKRRVEDPLVLELRRKSRPTMFSKKGKLLKLPVIRGGQNLKVKGLSLLIKSKKLAALVRAIVNARLKQKQLRLLRLLFITLNTALTTSVGLRFAVGGSLSYTQFVLIALPSTAGGLIMGLTLANPLASALLPLAILYGRGIEDISDPYEKCKAMCKIAEEFHNKQLTVEMKELHSLVEDTSTTLDKIHLLCVEQKLSLSQRYKLIEVIKSEKAQKRMRHFSEFIKKFPECDADPKVVYEQIVEKIAE